MTEVQMPSPEAPEPPVRPAISREDVVALSVACKENAAAQNERLRAFDSYERSAWPVTNDEIWRYTPIDKFPIGDMLPEHRVPVVSGAGEGVTVSSYSDAMKDGTLPSVFPTSLQDGQYSAVRALLSAVHSGGVVIDIAKSQSAELTLSHTSFGGAYVPRILICVRRGVEASIMHDLRELMNGSSPAGFFAPLVEIVIEQGAKLKLLEIQDLGRKQIALQRTRVRVERDGRFSGMIASFGGKLVRHDFDVIMAGERAECEVVGVAVTDGRQHFDAHTLQHHAVPSCRSNFYFKNALAGRSRSIFCGKILVDENAQKTDAYQTNRNLLLSREAKVDSIPNLEILADDVRCSHGSTTGQDSTEEIFYLMSRGLPRKLAERMLITAFFEDVVGRATELGFKASDLEHIHNLFQSKVERSLDA